MIIGYFSHDRDYGAATRCSVLSHSLEERIKANTQFTFYTSLSLLIRLHINLLSDANVHSSRLEASCPIQIIVQTGKSILSLAYLIRSLLSSDNIYGNEPRKIPWWVTMPLNDNSTARLMLDRLVDTSSVTNAAWNCSTKRTTRSSVRSAQRCIPSSPRIRSRSPCNKSLIRDSGRRRRCVK